MQVGSLVEYNPGVKRDQSGKPITPRKRYGKILAVRPARKGSPCELFVRFMILPGEVRYRNYYSKTRIEGNSYDVWVPASCVRQIGKSETTMLALAGKLWFN
jgi:hypothetical protein